MIKCFGLCYTEYSENIQTLQFCVRNNMLSCNSANHFEETNMAARHTQSYLHLARFNAQCCNDWGADGESIVCRDVLTARSGSSLVWTLGLFQTLYATLKSQRRSRVLKLTVITGPLRCDTEQCSLNVHHVDLKHRRSMGSTVTHCAQRNKKNHVGSTALLVNACLCVYVHVFLTLCGHEFKPFSWGPQSIGFCLFLFNKS